MNTAYLSLGSNLYEKKQNLQTAVNLLREVEGVTIDKISGIYLTEPIGFKYQDDFLNIVVKLYYEGDAFELLKKCKKIEKKMKRVISFRWGPRTIDIDIISFGDKIIDSKDLKLPHPEFKNRKFVLIPLMEISPDYVCPLDKKRIDKIISNCKDKSKINRLKSELV